MLQAIQSIDTAILLFIQENIRCGFLDVVMIFFTTIGNNGVIWLVLSAGLMITKKYRLLGFHLLLAVAVCWALNDLILKNIVQRPRPFLITDNIEALIPLPGSYSFPSGHTNSSFAAAYVITKSLGKRAAWVYIVAGMIALSRIYVGVHYPTDILAGAMIGTAGSILVYQLCLRYIRHPKE